MKINNETKVGILIVSALAMLFGLTYKTGKFNFSKEGYIIKIQFKDIDGVNLKSPVMYNGFEVGIVEDVMIKDDLVNQESVMELTIWLNDQVKLREGTKAYVKNLGFMGEKYVGLTSGKKGGAYLNSEDVIIGEPPPNFEKLISDGQQIADQLKKISFNVNERLEKNKQNVDAILTNINMTTKNMSSLAVNMDERLENNKENVDAIINNLQILSTNLEEMSYDLKMNPWKLLHKSKERTKDN